MNAHVSDGGADLHTDNRLAELEVHIVSRLHGRIRDFRLVLQDTGLVLRGYTRTYYAKQLAQHAVMELADLPILANDIEVR